MGVGYGAWGMGHILMSLVNPDSVLYQLLSEGLSYSVLTQLAIHNKEGW